jgi:pimeloyl-ACP methyl ester carboxylesterase
MTIIQTSYEETEVRHRQVDSAGLSMHVAEAGEGPLVLLLHGFPETSRSWRHQLPALAAAGYHAVAPDQRGYGRTDRPPAIEDYTILHLVGDVVGLIDALGETEAVLVGHDWGAIVAWDVALMRPDVVRGVVGLSVPNQQRGSASLMAGPEPPVARIVEAVGEAFYMIYFQRPGVADEDLGRDPCATLRRLYYSASAEAEPGAWNIMVAPGCSFLDTIAEPERMPAWLDDADLEAAARSFESSGFTGGLNWYRNLDRNAALTRAWKHAQVTPPALFIAGERDLAVAMEGGAEAITQKLRASVPNLRQAVFVPDCGHWTPQERPGPVNDAIIDFIDALPLATAA